MLRKGRKLLNLLRHKRYLWALKHGVGAAIEHTPLLRHSRFATVVDAGANKGQFALVARFHNPDSRIYSFEPLAGPARVFAAVFAGDRNTVLLRHALGSAEEEAMINVSGRADSSSLLPISALQNENFPGTAAVGQEAISVRRLDDVASEIKIKEPALLKIDVQGFEMELLKGAEQSLASFSDIYVELSFVPFYEGQALAPEVIAWLDGRGFSLKGIYNFTSDIHGLCAQADFHFARQVSPGNAGSH
jgi:FkbM family methyltransferase